MALGQMIFGKLGGFRGLDRTTVGGFGGPRSQLGSDDERAERFQNFLGGTAATGSLLQKLGAGLGVSKSLKAAAFEEETSAIQALTQGHFALAEGVQQFTAIQEALTASAGVRGVIAGGSVQKAVEETETSQSVFEAATISQARISNILRLQRAAKLRRQAKRAKFDSILGFGTGLATAFGGGGGGA